MSKNLERALAQDEATRILVVNSHLGSETTEMLSRDGHEVLELTVEDRPRRLLGVFAPELILLLCPEPARVCRELREAAPEVAIIAVISGRSVEDRVRVLDAGADDCLGSAFDRSELRARLRAVRRHRAELIRQREHQETTSGGPA